MTSPHIFDRLTLILRDVFDDDGIIATPDLTARQVSGWDSLANVRFFIDVELAFGIRFSATEIVSVENLGALGNLIETKIRHKGTR